MEKNKKMDLLRRGFSAKGTGAKTEVKESVGLENKAAVPAKQIKNETKKETTPKKIKQKETVEEKVIIDNTVIEEKKDEKPADVLGTQVAEVTNDVKVVDMPISVTNEKGEEEKPVKKKAAEEQPVVAKPKTPVKNAPALPSICSKLGGELIAVGFELPNSIKDVIVELAEEKTRKYVYIFNLLLEYALETNPISEYKETLKFSKDKKKLHTERISAEIMEKVDELCEKLDRKKNFVLNMLLEYALEQIGRI